MKRIIGLLIICFFCDLVEAQVLNQDAEGNSSIVWPGGSIGINTKDELFKFNYYTPYNNSKGKIWGFDLQGKNSSGIADLFTDGDFSPKAELSVLGGYHYSRIKGDEYIEKKEKYHEMKGYLEDQREKYSKNFYKFFLQRKKALLNDIDLSIPKDIKYDLENLDENDLGKLDPSEISNSILEIISNSRTEGQTKETLKHFSNDIKENRNLKKYIKANIKILSLEKPQILTTPGKKTYSTKTLLYIRAGLNVQEFKYDNRTETGIFKDRFVDTSFTSLLGQIGITHRRKNTFFGLNIGYEGINTFSALKKAEYSYTEVDTSITSGTLASKESFKAYSGDYETLSRIRIHSDILFSKSLGGTNKYAFFGPYMRFNFNTDTDILDNNSVLGFGTYFINGKEGTFLGGLYLQSNDIFGQKENPEFKESISFGIVAKFSFGSISPL